MTRRSPHFWWLIRITTSFPIAAQEAGHPSAHRHRADCAYLGYDVTVVKDATADYSDEMMHAALEVNLPNYASAIVAPNEMVDLISSL
jgi:hypothetical protein